MVCFEYDLVFSLVRGMLCIGGIKLQVIHFMSTSIGSFSLVIDMVRQLLCTLELLSAPIAKIITGSDPVSDTRVLVNGRCIAIAARKNYC